MSQYELTLDDLRPEVAKKLLKQGYIDTNHDIIPIVILMNDKYCTLCDTKLNKDGNCPFIGCENHITNTTSP